MRILLAAALLATATLSAPAAAGVTAAQYERTIAVLEPMVAQSPNDAEAQLNLGMAYHALGREAEARTALHAVMRLDNETLQNRYGSDVWSHSLAREALATMQ